MAESVILPLMSSLTRTSLKLFAVAGLLLTATAPGSAQSRAAVTVEVTHDVDLLLAQALGLPRPTIRRQATMVIF